MTSQNAERRRDLRCGSMDKLEEATGFPGEVRSGAASVLWFASTVASSFDILKYSRLRFKRSSALIAPGLSHQIHSPRVKEVRVTGYAAPMKR